MMPNGGGDLLQFFLGTTESITGLLTFIVFCFDETIRTSIFKSVKKSVDSSLAKVKLVPLSLTKDKEEEVIMNPNDEHFVTVAGAAVIASNAPNVTNLKKKSSNMNRSNTTSSIFTNNSLALPSSSISTAPAIPIPNQNDGIPPPLLSNDHSYPSGVATPTTPVASSFVSISRADTYDLGMSSAELENYPSLPVPQETNVVHRPITPSSSARENNNVDFPQQQQQQQQRQPSKQHFYQQQLPETEEQYEYADGNGFQGSNDHENADVYIDEDGSDSDDSDIAALEDGIVGGRRRYTSRE